MTTTTRRLVVVSGGLSEPSSTRLLADRLAAASADALREHHATDVEVEVIDLRDHAHDLTNNLLTGFATDALQRAKDAVTRADGIVAVTPIYSGSYTGLFKTFFDVLESGTLTEAPVLIAATAGTSRHSLALEHALRPLFSYLGAVVVPTAVFAAAEDWGVGGDVDGRLASRIERAAGQLATLVVTQRPAAVRDPFEDPTPFEELLRS